ncbi:prephenate dehydrogenase [Streptomyces sp. NPDC054887]
MRTAAVVGTGLIGTSIALALTGRGITTHLIDRDPDGVRLAAARGAGTPESPTAPVDIAVIAVPPSQVATALAAQQESGLAKVYTDVAAVKAPVYDACVDLGCDTTSLVGGHPLAGRERSGPLAARADLFQDRHWVLTPAADTREAALNRALELVSLCGAVPVLLEHRDHDRAVALVSHLPHLMASLTAARLLEGEDYAVRLAGRGMGDLARIAAGDAGLWADVLACNAAAVGPLLADLTDDLRRTADALEGLTGGGRQSREAARADLTDILRRGSEGHSRVVTTHGYGGTEVPPASLSVALVGRDRPLARLLDDVNAERMDLEGMVLPDDGPPPHETVEIQVAAEIARPLTVALRDRGWAVHQVPALA